MRLNVCHVSLHCICLWYFVGFNFHICFRMYHMPRIVRFRLVPREWFWNCNTLVSSYITTLHMDHVKFTLFMKTLYISIYGHTHTSFIMYIRTSRTYVHDIYTSHTYVHYIYIYIMYVCVAGSSVSYQLRWHWDTTQSRLGGSQFIYEHQEQPCKTIQYILQTRIKHNTFNNIKTPMFTIQYIQKC